MQWPKLRKSPGADPAAPDVENLDPVAAARLTRLARKLDLLPAKDEVRIRQAEELEQRQAHGGHELFDLCLTLVKQLNAILENLRVDLTPAEFHPETMDSASGSLIQINASGRILQVLLYPRENAVTTEHFRIPYILRGAVRWFNQEYLERQEIQEQLLFYCVSGKDYSWRYLDTRSRKSGTVDQDYLADTMEQLL